jgi:hypothetical protein
MYLLPFSERGSGPRKSIPIISNGCVACVIMCNGVIDDGGAFLAAQLGKDYIFNCVRSHIWPIKSAGDFKPRFSFA